MPEHAAKSEKFVSRAKSFARASGIFVILIGLVALSGWIFDVPKLKSIYGDITMKANAALALILTGAGAVKLNDTYFNTPTYNTTAGGIWFVSGSWSTLGWATRMRISTMRT